MSNEKHTDYLIVLDITGDDGLIFKVGLTQNDINKMIEADKHSDMEEILRKMKDEAKEAEHE